MNIIQYIRESCEMQEATEPDDYIGMTMAYDCADRFTPAVMRGGMDLGILSWLILYVSADKIVSYRSQPAYFANGNFAVDPDLIVDQLMKLMLHQSSLTPVEFYKRLMEIHPWRDGNGRVGSLVYNMLNSTIRNPVHPPNCFD